MTNQFNLYRACGRQNIDALIRILGVLVDRHILLEPLVKGRKVYLYKIWKLLGGEDEDPFCSFTASGEGGKLYLVGSGGNG